MLSCAPFPTLGAHEGMFRAMQHRTKWFWVALGVLGGMSACKSKGDAPPPAASGSASASASLAKAPAPVPEGAPARPPRRPCLSCTDGRLPLSAGWRIQSSAKVPQAGLAISTAGFAADEWYAVTVPTTVLAGLVANGVYPDPYVGDNLKIPPPPLSPPRGGTAPSSLFPPTLPTIRRGSISTASTTAPTCGSTASSSRRRPAWWAPSRATNGT